MTSKNLGSAIPNGTSRGSVRSAGNRKVRSAESNGLPSLADNGGIPKARLHSDRERPGTMKNALGAQVPVREWDHLSAASRTEIEHMVEVLKAMKQGDFSVRFEYEKHGVLSRAGELLMTSLV